MSNENGKLRVYADADVLIAGAATDDRHAASHVSLVASEITLIDLITTQTAIDEARRNVQEQLPEALPELQAIANRSLTVLPPPDPETEKTFYDLADDKDAVHLAGAVQHNCRVLITYNLSDYEPGHSDVMVIEPGELVARMRTMMQPIDRMEAMGMWSP